MLRAKHTFFIPGHRVVAGNLFADDDPIVSGREDLFEQVDVPVAPEAPEDQGQKKTAARKTTAKKPAG